MKNKKLNYYLNLLILIFLILQFCPFHLIRTAQENTNSEAIYKPDLHFFTGRQMTLDYQISIGRKISKTEQQKIEKIIAETFQEIDTVYNKWNPESEISKINRAKGNQNISLSPKLENFLMFVNEIVVLSEGRFDPTIEPLQQLWKNQLEKGLVPADHEIQKLLPTLGWEKIHFGNGQISKDHDLISLDLSGIAKGFCVDLLVERLLEADFTDVLVNWEGEIRAHGKHPSNRPWRVMVSRLDNDDPNQAIAYIDLNNQSIATSGDYVQNWKVAHNEEQITYFHVIDPSTRRPLVVSQGSVASATVVTSSCALADALATVAMMFPNKDEASKWAEKVMGIYPDILFKLYSRDEQ